MQQIQNEDIFQLLQSQSTEELLVMLDESQNEENYEEIHATIKQMVMGRGDDFRETNKTKFIVNSLIEEMNDFNLLIRKELRYWGVGLIISGIIHLILYEYLDPIWGVLITVVGILALFYQKREMFVVLGAAMLLAGVGNIASGMLSESFWSSYGLLQLYWGYKEIKKFKLYAPLKEADTSEKTEKEDFESIVSNEQIPGISDETETTVIINENAFINEENLERVKVLISGLKSAFKSGKSAGELSHLFSRMIASQNDAIQLILQYRSKIGQDLIGQINKHTSSYALKKQLLRKFIEHGIVENDYPHEYLVNLANHKTDSYY
jgi:hypothetical protein